MRRFGYIDVAVYQGAKDLPPMEVAHPLTGACTPRIVICPVMNSTHRRTYNLYDLFYLWTSLPRGKTIGACRRNSHLRFPLAPQPVKTSSRAGTFSGVHGVLNNNFGDRVKGYNDVFRELYYALFGTYPTLPITFRQSRTLVSNCLAMFDKIDTGDWDAMCVPPARPCDPAALSDAASGRRSSHHRLCRWRVEMRRCNVTLAEVRAEICAGLFGGQNVLRELDPVPDEERLLYLDTGHRAAVAPVTVRLLPARPLPRLPPYDCRCSSGPRTSAPSSQPTA